MTFIDWSDPDEMFGLLCEYVADARHDAEGDPARLNFLRGLSAELDGLAEEIGALSPAETIEMLRAIRGAQPREFRDDDVLRHVDDCIEELERIRRDGGG